MSIAADKSTLREQATIARKAAKAANPDAGVQVAARLIDYLNGLHLAPSSSVSSYIPIGSEIDTLPAADLLAEDHTLALPIVTRQAAPLVFRRWKLGDPLGDGTMSIPVPMNSQPEIEPDVLLVPLLAFDNRGYRLGYGGGFYDRTLAQLEAKAPRIAIGLAFDEQQVDAVPTVSTDIALRAIVTPTRALIV